MALYDEKEWRELCRKESETAYGSAYIEHADRFRKMWRDRTIIACSFALTDLHATLAMWPYQTAYTGKLWAEVDAIRDRQAALRRESL